MADTPKFHNPFEALRKLVPAEELARVSPPTPQPAPKPPSATTTKTVGRAVVRMERAGRGGKEATVISHLDLSEAERAKWLKALKASLGCGGTLDADTIVLQGDHRERLPALLTARGVKKVTIG